MKPLTRNEMKQLKGGAMWNCTVTFTDGSTLAVNNVSGGNEQQARVNCRGSYNNVSDSSCTQIEP